MFLENIGQQQKNVSFIDFQSTNQGNVLLALVSIKRFKTMRKWKHHLGVPQHPADIQRWKLVANWSLFLWKRVVCFLFSEEKFAVLQSLDAGLHGSLFTQSALRV